MKPEQQNDIQFDYSFPNAVVFFWYFTTPWILILIFLLLKYREEIWALQLSSEHFQLIIESLISSIFFVPVFAGLVVNMFPAIRLKPGGIEIQFYFPIITKWIFVSWNQIDKVEIFSFPSATMLRKKRENLFIYSKQLPFYYQMVAILYRHSFSRGFIVSANIRKRDELMRIIELYKNIKITV